MNNDHIHLICIKKIQEAKKDEQQWKQLIKNRCFTMRDSLKDTKISEIDDEDIPSSSTNYFVEDLMSLTKAMQPDPLVYIINEQISEPLDYII